MASNGHHAEDLNSYTIVGTNVVVKAGDCVLLQPSEIIFTPGVARIEKIGANNRHNKWIKVRWYYRPQQAVGGRRQFHGEKELFFSDQYDIQSTESIMSKCIVHTFDNYLNLDAIGLEDYYCRFEYQHSSGSFQPYEIAVYCKCEMPINPDHFMIECKQCEDWYHRDCIDMTIDEAKQLDKYTCSDCA